MHFRVSLAELRAYFPVAGVAGVMVGLVFYGFSLLQNQLTKSVARLKEAEFAEKEVELARAMQQRILPPEEIAGEGYRISARNLPARFVAGDFYDVFSLARRRGRPRRRGRRGQGNGRGAHHGDREGGDAVSRGGRGRVDEVLREANRRLKPRLEAREFVALAYARYEPKTGRFELGNAGLPDPYVLGAGANGRPRALSVPGPRFPLGVRREVAYEKVSGTLAPGERLLLVSDGLPEAPTPDGRAPRLRAVRGNPRARQRAGRALRARCVRRRARRSPTTGPCSSWSARREPRGASEGAGGASRRRDARETESLAWMRRFVAAPEDPFARENPVGHVTASAVVARPGGEAFLLVFHRKLSRWLQPGGHVEHPTRRPSTAALREASEETGIRIARFEAPLGEAIFDVDVHGIPARRSEPAHHHFDVRFVLTTESEIDLAASDDPTRPIEWRSWRRRCRRASTSRWRGRREGRVRGFVATGRPKGRPYRP